MSKTVITTVSLILLLTFVALIPFLAGAALAGPHVVLIPEISIPETEFDFGELDEGVEARHTFKIQNVGKKSLVIKTAYSTCGCTVPHIKKKELSPGEAGDLEVVMNTSMKQGDITKPIEIRTNDPKNPVSTIFIKAHVKSPHANMGTDKIAKIFTGRCAACHVKNGIGMLGEELYFADCAMCHGYRAKGIPSVGPPLIPFDYHSQSFAEQTRKIISDGSTTHRSMPGYAKSAGGPLDDKEIDSLMDYLKHKSDLELKAQKN